MTFLGDYMELTELRNVPRKRLSTVKLVDLLREHGSSEAVLRVGNPGGGELFVVKGELAIHIDALREGAVLIPPSSNQNQFSALVQLGIMRMNTSGEAQFYSAGNQYRDTWVVGVRTSKLPLFAGIIRPVYTPIK